MGFVTLPFRFWLQQTLIYHYGLLRDKRIGGESLTLNIPISQQVNSSSRFQTSYKNTICSDFCTSPKVMSAEHMTENNCQLSIYFYKTDFCS